MPHLLLQDSLSLKRNSLALAGFGFPLIISVLLSFLRPRKIGNHSGLPGAHFGMQIWKLFFSADTHDSGFHNSRHWRLYQAAREGHLICKVTNPRIQIGHHWQRWKEVVCLSFLGDPKIGRPWGPQVPCCTLIPTQGKGCRQLCRATGGGSVLVKAILVADNRKSNQWK